MWTGMDRRRLYWAPLGRSANSCVCTLQLNSQLNSQLKDILVYKKGIVQTQQHQLTMISIPERDVRKKRVFYFIHKLAVSKKNGFH